jgi:hypothetical protein
MKYKYSFHMYIQECAIKYTRIVAVILSVVRGMSVPLMSPLSDGRLPLQKVLSLILGSPDSFLTTSTFPLGEFWDCTLTLQLPFASFAVRA